MENPQNTAPKTAAQALKLANGVTCVCETRPKSGKVTMLIGIRSGSAYEPGHESGLTHLMQEATWGGTHTRSRDQIAEDIESRGGSFGSDADRHSTKFVAVALSRDAADIFAILSDVVRNPAFDAAEIQNTKDRIAYMIDEENQSPGHKASLGFYGAAFAGQPIAAAPMGTKELVSAFTTEQIMARHTKILSDPENIVISFAGDINFDTATALAEKHFGDLKQGPKRAPLTLEFIGGEKRESNENNQLNLVLGFPAPAINDPKRLHAIMLKELLSGGMSSPLFQEIREKRGLVYSVGAGFSPMESAGLFYISAGTGKGNAGELIPAALDLLGDIIRNGYTDNELRSARERIIRSTKSAMESTRAICFRNASQIQNFDRLISLEEMETLLNQVTSDDIRATTAALLETGRYALGAVGPMDSMPDETTIRSLILKQVEGVQLPKSAARKPATPPQTVTGDKNDPVTTTDPQMSVLENGMIVVTTERAGSLSCGAWVGAGADHETPELNGATHMNEHMMFKGTPNYGPGTIDKIIEGELGGALNAYTSKDQTAYYFYNLLPGDIEKVIDICGEMVFKANLDHAEFDGIETRNPDGTITKSKGERDVVIEEIKRANDSIGSVMWDLLSTLTCPEQSHGRPVLGTETTLRAMTVQALAAYRDEYYVPNNVVFSAAGPVKHADFVNLIKRKYGAMPAHPIKPLPTPTYCGGVGYKEMESAELCQFVLAAQAVPTNHPDILVYTALGEILGGGASSRLYKSLVNTSLTSDIGVGCNDYRNFGSFVVVAAIDANNMKKVVGIIYEELHSLLNTLSKGELEKAKSQMEMDVISRIETNKNACDTYGQMTLAQGKPETSAQTSAKIQAIHEDDIKRVIKDILSCDPVLAMVVPKGTDPACLPDMETMMALRGNTAKAA